MTTATVELWGTTVGYVSMDESEQFARFEYDPDFVKMGIEIAPSMMPLQARRIFRFPDLETRSFHGLPGLLADSLPDKYGQSLINIWLARTGRTPDKFNAVDRLCYTGRRGMGALEFHPTTRPDMAGDKMLEIAQLTELASMAFAKKEALDIKFDELGGDDALLEILSVSSSAGGARAKAVIAYNPDTKQVRSGQLDIKPGFQHWLIKFDGVEFGGDWGVADPKGYGLLEYSYHEIAKKCDVNMSECRIFSESGRNHFMTRRFDRDEKIGKKFIQSFAALSHYDYYKSGYYSYEQLFLLMKQLNISMDSMEQQFRRVVFNLVGCNQDDHVKNFAFSMDRGGNWDLTPAYDLCHSEGSEFTRNHQLSINGKINDFTKADIKYLANYIGLPRGREIIILEQITEAFSAWGIEAANLNIPIELRDHVKRTLRLNW